jgi:serine/threonine-protein kinase
MVDPQTSRFWQAALQSGLIDVDGLRGCWEGLPPEKRVADQLDRRLARQAVQAGLLTLWQAQQLLAGRSMGFKIDRYVLLDMIGQGGMGRVYLARDSRLNRRVALKILSPERVNNPRAIARFQREARVGAQLQHENLVRIYDEGEANGKCYLVMEYIEGRNIGSIIQEKGPIRPSMAARLVRQVALGLQHAQLKGLIHRDVNPYNILVTKDGAAKLTDLGLAIDLTEQVQVTRDGATVGTFDYISPEQARHSHSVDTRSDIYSLGCTLYHMLTGQVPYPSPSLPEKLFGHQSVEPTPLRTLMPGVPEGLAEVVRKMMRKVPDERYANPLQVAQALEPFLDESSPAYQGLPPAGTALRIPLGPTVSASDVPGAPSPPSPGGVTQAMPAAQSLPPELGGLPPAVPPTLDMSGLGLGLDLGPEPTLSELAAAKGKPRPKGPASPASPLPSPPPESSDAVPDFGRIGAEPAARKDDLATLGLALDLGPEPTLSEVLASKSKARSAPPESKPATPAPEPPAPRPQAQAQGQAKAQPQGPAASAEPVPPSAAEGGAGKGGEEGAAAAGRSRKLDRRVVLAAAAALIAVVAGVLYAGGVLDRSGPPKAPAPRPPRVSDSPTGPGPPSPPGPDAQARIVPPRPAAGAGKADEVPAGQAIAVRAADGTLTRESDLKSAMQRAIGSKGQVLLNNREPLKFSGAAAALRVNGGSLTIRAAEGARPVLEVEIKGKAPFLSAGTGTPLTLIGVTVVARYEGTGIDPPPVIDAAAAVKLEHCAFRAVGTARSGSAVKVQGKSLGATGCWFEGFERALDVAAYRGSAVTIRQCMMVHAPVDDKPAGWGLRVRCMPGGAPKGKRQLALEHCTVLGRGLLDVVDFTSRMPYRVEVKECAAAVDALLAWEPLEPPATVLTWTGQGNQYEVQGKSWVVLSPADAAPLRDGPTDLDTWGKFVRETAPLTPPLKFHTAPADRSEAARPEDFAIEGSRGAVGADPKQVGPAARPGASS